MRRAIEIKFKDGASATLDLSKVTSVRTSKEMLHLDKLDDGTWRMIYNENLNGKT